MLFQRFFAAALIASLGTRLAAGQSAPVTTEPPPRYNVEVIVFAHTDVDPTEELFDTGPAHAGDNGAQVSAPQARDVIAVEPFGPRRTDPADELAGVAGLPRSAGGGPGDSPQAPAGTAIGADAAPPQDPLEFIDPFGSLAARPADEQAADAALGVRVLGADELTLGDAQRIIDRLGAYRLLGHGGWQQAGVEQNAAEPLDLARIGIINPSGTIMLYLGRFLHVTLDLAYRSPASPPVGFGPGVPSTLAEIELPQTFRLQTERNALRSGELHYIDHPRFGVLILVTPAPQPEEPVDATAIAAPSA